MAKPGKPFHPPAPGNYRAPESDSNGYIDGDAGLAGFGGRAFYVAAIPCAEARRIIRENHYSGTVVNNSYVHLGVFVRGELMGAMQLGYLLNPATAGRIVAGTVQGQYLELNRMWLDDRAVRNSESRAISYAIKYIRRAIPMVRWIQSFADERCGGYGVVYQACNFRYLGEHRTRFYELDGVYYHEIAMTRHKKAGRRGAYLRANRHRARPCHFRQFRYIIFMAPRFRAGLKFTIERYPKLEHLTRPVHKTSRLPAGASRAKLPEVAPPSRRRRVK